MDITTLKSNITKFYTSYVRVFQNGFFFKTVTEKEDNTTYYRIYKSSDFGKTWSIFYSDTAYYYGFMGFLDENNCFLLYDYARGYGYETLRKLSSDGTITEISGWPQYGTGATYINGYFFIYINSRSYSLYKYNKAEQSISLVTTIEEYKNKREWVYLGSVVNTNTSQTFAYIRKSGDGEQTYIYQIGIPDSNHDYVIYKRPINIYNSSSEVLIWQFASRLVLVDDYIYLFSESFAWRIPKNSISSDEVEFLGGRSRVIIKSCGLAKIA